MINTLAIQIVEAIQPQKLAINTSVTATQIDTRPDTSMIEADWMDVILHIGGTNDCGLTALKLQSSDTSGSGFADLAGSDYSASGNTLPAASVLNSYWAWHVDLRGKKRYYQIVLTSANTGSNGITISAEAILSRCHTAPSTAALRGFAYELNIS